MLESKALQGLKVQALYFARTSGSIGKRDDQLIGGKKEMDIEIRFQTIERGLEEKEDA